MLIGVDIGGTFTDLVLSRDGQLHIHKLLSTPHDPAIAMLEGLAYALRDGAERTSKRSGVPITELRVAGGGSQSQAAMQLTADIFGLPTSRPHVYEASGLGAAIDAAVGLGLHPDFKSAVREMTHLGEVFEPKPNNHAIYNELYNQVYRHLYKRLNPLYNALYSIFQRE